MCNKRWIYSANLPAGPVDMVGRQVRTVMSSPQMLTTTGQRTNEHENAHYVQIKLWTN